VGLLPALWLLAGCGLHIRFEVAGHTESPLRRVIDRSHLLDAQPLVYPNQTRGLATWRWVANRGSFLRLGPPRVGKTYLAVALAGKASVRACSTTFTPAPSLVAKLARAQSEGRLKQRLLRPPKLLRLVVQELGDLPFEANTSHLYFQLVRRREERGSMLAKSNRRVADGEGVLGGEIVVTATLDGAPCPSHVLANRDDSHRSRIKRRTRLTK
jgi:DNA replication protein DnaC